MMGARGAAPAGRYVDREVVQRVVKVLDIAYLFAAAIAVSFLTAAHAWQAGEPQTIGFVAAELSLTCVFVLRSIGLYDVDAMTSPAWTALRATASCFIAGATTYLLSNYFLVAFDRSWLALWFAATAGYFAVTRGAIGTWARPILAERRFLKRVAIVGGGKAAEEALFALDSNPKPAIEIVGIFDDRFDARSPGTLGKHHKVGKIAELADYARNNRVDLIIVAIPLSAEARLLHILKRLWELPVDIRISGKASALKLGPRAYTYLGKLPLLTVFDRPLKGWSLFLKDILDRIIAGFAIILLSPVMAAVALAVKLESKGPVIFRQRRYGFNNELIEVFKFRSMYVEQSDSHAVKLVTKDDARVTRVGRFIRKASVDELPQLFNVLTGQLSLVGPRPHATQAKAADDLYEKVVDGYFARHKVKPGITGWAQINGWRGETDTREKIEQRVRYDLDYIDRWSIWFDLSIIIKTPFALLKSENAY